MKNSEELFKQMKGKFWLLYHTQSKVYPNLAYVFYVNEERGYDGFGEDWLTLDDCDGEEGCSDFPPLFFASHYESGDCCGRARIDSMFCETEFDYCLLEEYTQPNRKYWDGFLTEITKDEYMKIKNAIIPATDIAYSAMGDMIYKH